MQEWTGQSVRVEETSLTLDEFRAVTEGPLGPKGAGQGGPKSEGLTRAVEVEDRGEGGKSNRESKRRAKEGRGASR